MAMNFEDMLGKITDFIKNEAKTETVVGDPFTLGEFTCVPVIRFGAGFGSGGGSGSDPNSKGKGEGGGAGAGFGIEPIGFLVSRGEEISFISTVRNKGLSAAFEKVPDLIEKLANKKKEGK